jgi:putative aldouronate transport system substrate-binding protein
MHNPDGLSAQDALRQYGIQSMLTLLQDARYERAFVSDEVNRTRDLYEQEGHIGPAFPTLAFTDEERDIINEKYTDIETYVNETLDKFIMGRESLDGFDAFVEQVNGMGLPEVLKVYQDAYNRYMGL